MSIDTLPAPPVFVHRPDLDAAEQEARDQLETCADAVCVACKSSRTLLHVCAYTRVIEGRVDALDNKHVENKQRIAVLEKENAANRDEIAGLKSAMREEIAKAVAEAVTKALSVAQ